MRLAITGSSSTGKSELAKALLRHPIARKLLRERVNLDARRLIEQLGHRSMDEMNQEEARAFELIYFFRKRELEFGKQQFLTERSFVDVAAYWLGRDASPAVRGVTEYVVAECEARAREYDLHVLLPFGAVPFVEDGYRSADGNFHRQIDQRIRDLLSAWKLETITLRDPDLLTRVDAIVSYVELRSEPGL